MEEVKLAINAAQAGDASEMIGLWILHSVCRAGRDVYTKRNIRRRALPCRSRKPQPRQPVYPSGYRSRWKFDSDTGNRDLYTDFDTVQ